MDRPTVDVYEAEGARYAVRRGIQDPDRSQAFGTSLPAGALRLDLGCGPGHHLPLLGRPAVACDAARSMVAAAAAANPGVPAVQADLIDLPFGRASFDAVWASKAHQHVPAADLPLALADVHRVLRVGGRFELTMFAGERELVSGGDDDLPGRLFALWPPDRLRTVVEAAGFAVDRLTVRPGDGFDRIELTATALRALPDHVGPDMRLLCCGLNPSLHAADAGVGYVTGSNRFWPAMAAAGLCTRDRDPRHLLRHDRIGMTDLVKRATARADELDRTEYAGGVDRLRDLCEWLRPGALAVVGLAGWRAAVDPKAGAGWQAERLGPTPVYLLPSTSGLNARVSLAELTDHLVVAAARP